MYKLLLVDDEPIIREGLERIIDWEKLDLKLTASCPNAIAALDSMTDDMPDILLTDIRLPGMTGLELVQRAVTLHPMLQTAATFDHVDQIIYDPVFKSHDNIQIPKTQIRIDHQYLFPEP